MALSYAMRVVCLVGVSMILLQALVELLLWVASPVILRLLRALTTRQRERALYLVQLIPAVSAVLLTASFFLPRYVSNETNFASERVGWLCLVLAASLYLGWAVRLVSGGRMVLRTIRFSHACKVNAGAATSPGGTPVVIAEGYGARVALVGLLHPFIVISRSLMEQDGLDPLALDVIFDHEQSHAAQGDNWKLLSLRCLPRLGLKVSQGRTWLQLWQNSAEWAADEDAVRGSRARALLLAGTLVKLARSGSAPTPHIACTYFACEENELKLRVERLIYRTPGEPLPRNFKAYLALGCASAAALIFFVTLTSALGDVPEYLLHLG